MTEMGIEGQQLMARRPRHLVLFADGADAERELAVSVDRGIRTISQSPGTRILEASGRREIKVFDGLGIAAGDFDEQTRELLEHSDAVESVVSNERRTLPPFVIEESPLVRGDLKSVRLEQAPAGPLTAYVRGMRDALDLVLRQLEDGREVEDSREVRAVMNGPGAAGDGQTWCLDLMGLSRATRFDGSGVVVAVLDTGVDPDHPDLGHLFPGGANMETFVGGTPRDGNGHGTHCIGVIASRARPHMGPRYGLAPRVTMLSGKVLEDDGSGHDDQIMEGIAWAAANGAHIISTSFGSRRDGGARFDAAYEGLGQRLARRGILLVAAAGNGSRRDGGRVAPVEDPAACPSFKAVAAIDRDLAVAPFSCGQVDYAPIAIAAPGVAVHSAWPGGGYKLLSGTSMATPHVAGAAALWWQRSSNHVWSDIVAAARDLGSPSDFGAGLVRIPEAGHGTRLAPG